MAIDMTEVQQLFYEESYEGLDSMESILLDLEVGTLDKEITNSIFRVVHSIKGGAGIFKFDQVVTFAHVAETLLDEMRNGQHVVTQHLIDLLLNSVDVLRMMLGQLRGERTLIPEEIDRCQRELEAVLKKNQVTTTPPPVDAAVEVSPPEILPDSAPLPVITAQKIWHVHFKPYPSLLKTGNDPLNLFRELSNLGELTVKVDTRGLPNFADLVAENCYLAWELTLHSSVELSEIQEIFEWVEGDCDLEIIQEVVDIPAAMPQASPVEPPPTSPESVVETIGTAETSPTLPPEPEADNIVAITTDATEIANAVSAIQQSVNDALNSENPPATEVPAVNAPMVTSSSSKIPIKEAITEKTNIANAGQQHNNETSSIRVGIDKIDALINMVGELVITQSMLDQVGQSFDAARMVQLRDGLAQLERNTRELQESVMRIRMLPIGFSFNRFPRLVHDLSSQLGKKVELKLSGEHTELDKTVLEKMSDPLVHLVRNALDHGIEMPEQRIAAGKPEVGLLKLHAFHQSGSIIIQISDDGAGIDLAKVLLKAKNLGLVHGEENLSEEQLYELIFHPGLSTATQVSDLSGRGVGMDVVRRNIRALGGTIDVKSTRGKGSTFNIRLPLTLAILDGQLVRIGHDIYILSLLSIIESLRVNSKYVNALAGRAEVYKLRDEYIPILRLYELFDIPATSTKLEEGLLVIVEGDGQKIGLFVDELLSQQQIVIKSLESNYKQIQGVSGATILGDGNVALILDVAGIIQLFHHRTNYLTRHHLHTSSSHVATVTI
jgi:two-component system, chemotaxis family, sensor kinase CheA